MLFPCLPCNSWTECQNTRRVLSEAVHFVARSLSKRLRVSRYLPGAPCRFKSAPANPRLDACSRGIFFTRGRQRPGNRVKWNFLEIVSRRRLGSGPGSSMRLGEQERIGTSWGGLRAVSRERSYIKVVILTHGCGGLRRLSKHASPPGWGRGITTETPMI